MKKLIFLCGLSACTPSYLVRPEEWARVGDHETIEAENDAGEKVRLKSKKLDDATTETEGDRVRVHPWNARYKAAAGLLTIGSILAVASAASFLSMLAPCQGDEVCFVPQTTAGMTLAVYSGLSLIIGTALLPSGLNDTLAR